MTATTSTRLKKVEIKHCPSLTETLKNLEIGVGNLFSTRDYKVQPVRNTASKLKKQGYDFAVTESGMVDQFIVTRLK